MMIYWSEDRRLVESEFNRMGFKKDSKWKISDINKDFELCNTYPRFLIVPSNFRDEDLESVAKFRYFGRVPTAVWRHIKNGCFIVRSSQPTVGWFGWFRSELDESLVQSYVNNTQSSSERLSGETDTTTTNRTEPNQEENFTETKIKANSPQQVNNVDNNDELIESQERSSIKSLKVVENSDIYNDQNTTNNASSGGDLSRLQSQNQSNNHNNNDVGDNFMNQSNHNNNLTASDMTPLPMHNNPEPAKLPTNIATLNSSQELSNSRRGAPYAPSQSNSPVQTPSSSALNGDETSSLQNISSSLETETSSATNNNNSTTSTTAKQPAATASKMLIIDARSYTAAMANRAKGGGCECSEYYSRCEVHFMNLANIHSIRKSYHAIRSVCEAYSEQSNK